MLIPLGQQQVQPSDSGHSTFSQVMLISPAANKSSHVHELMLLVIGINTGMGIGPQPNLRVPTLSNLLLLVDLQVLLRRKTISTSNTTVHTAEH